MVPLNPHFTMIWQKKKKLSQKTTNNSRTAMTCKLLANISSNDRSKHWWMEMYRRLWLVVSSSLNQISQIFVNCIIYNISGLGSSPFELELPKKTTWTNSTKLRTVFPCVTLMQFVLINESQMNNWIKKDREWVLSNDFYYDIITMDIKWFVLLIMPHKISSIFIHSVILQH